VGNGIARTEISAATKNVMQILDPITNSIIRPASFIRKEQYCAENDIVMGNAATGHVVNRDPPLLPDK
jgi:hypothetical protein